MMEMVVLIRKAVFRHESKHVATFPCKYGMPRGYFFFLCSQNNTLKSCLTWRILCMMWIPELFENQGFGKVIKSCLFSMDFAMKMTDILKEFYSFLSFHQLIQANHPFLQVAEPDCLEIIKYNQERTVNYSERIGTWESRIYLSSCS